MQLANIVRRPAVLPDGSYATQVAVETTPLGMPISSQNLRALLLVSRGGSWLGGKETGMGMPTGSHSACGLLQNREVNGLHKRRELC